MAFTPQNFVSQQGPAVSSTWLNGVDVTVNYVLGGAQTVAQAQEALGIPALPVPVAEGGTGATTAAAGLTALGGTTLTAVEAALTQSYLGGVLNPRTANETAVGVIPFNLAYAEGHLLRYLASWTPGVTDCTAALNSATAVCAYGKATLVLPYATLTAPILISGTWDCTAKYNGYHGYVGPQNYPNNTNGGLKVTGQGKYASVIQFISGGNNAGIGWDLTGCAAAEFRDFCFIGGSSTSNCPVVTVLKGAINPTGSGRTPSGYCSFQNVSFEGYGDNVIYNAGAEQITYIDCDLVAFRGVAFPNAQPIVFVASGSTPLQTSSLATTMTPVVSMTDVHWFGANASMIFEGFRGIMFHFTAATAGACADIRFNDWFQTTIGTGNAFQFMADDSSGYAGTGLFNCGGERLIMEGAGGNPNIQVCNFSVAVAKVKFEGHAGAGLTITQYPFQFTSTCVPTNCFIDWDPNESGGFSAGYIAYVAGTEAGIHVRAPVATANLIGPGTSRTIDGFGGIGWSGEGKDYSNLLGTHIVTAPVTTGSFVRTRKVRAANFVTQNSDWNEGVQTTASVSTTAAGILQIPNYANLVAVTGADAGGDTFCDLLWVTFTTVNVLQSAAESGSPGARTYTVVSNTLKVSMASGTYAVQASVIGFGMQA